MTPRDETDRLLDRLARTSRGRLLALLRRQHPDPAAAEDSLADAYCAAVAVWPRTGIPANPDGWLLTVARRRLIDRHRAARIRAAAEPALTPLPPAEMADPEPPFADPRLRLLFVCAHPGLDRSLHTPLMLQTVLGLSAGTIARVFLTRPATMGQRLSRAKATIRQKRLPFEVPDPAGRPDRLEPVLDAVYAAFTLGLRGEALFLSLLLAEMLPKQPEALGLAALLLHSQARAPAARSDGRYVPLAEQDTRLWSADSIATADRLLARAARLGQPGRFQLEAALQSVHNRRAIRGVTDWPTILLLYQGLLSVSPSLGAQLGYCQAVCEQDGPAPAWDRLMALPGSRMENHQPYWALRAHLLHRLGRRDESRAALHRAIALCHDPAQRAFLQDRLTDWG